MNKRTRLHFGSDILSVVLEKKKKQKLRKLKSLVRIKRQTIIGLRHAFPLANSARPPYIFESRRQDHRSWREDI